MPAKLNPAIRDFQTLFDFGRVGDCADGQLLDHFRSCEGPAAEVAFSTLIQRHGPMVLRVCRSVLNDEHDAQDAFQATFLVLVNRAGAVRKQASVASWLYGVAHRVASRAKVRAARRRAHERQAASRSAESQQDSAGVTQTDRTWLHEEIRRLPDKYRSIILLCYFEGLTQEQAAQQLGWPAGTARGRLFRARTLLRDRLTRRGFVVAGSTVLAALLPTDVIAVPTALIHSTARAAFAARSSAVGLITLAKSLPGHAGHVPQALSVTPLKATAALLGAGVIAAAVWGATETAADRLAGRPPARSEAPEPKAVVFTPESPQADSSHGGTTVDPLNPEFAPDATHQPPPPGAQREPAAVARPLTGITLDGKLDDWPKGIARYPVLKILPNEPMGWGGLQQANLTTSPDLSAWFSAGYDVNEQLLYLAVVVRDDKLVIGHTSHLDTDSVEVYVDGLFSNRRISIGSVQDSASRAPVQQYVGIPGPGRIYGLPAKTNPVLIYGDLSRTRTRMAYRRQGDLTTYEWAIQVFDHYPDKPTALVPGKRIGFDLAIADRDAPVTSTGGFSEPVSNRLSWIYWGPAWRGIKVLDAGNLGELLLEDSSQ